MQLEYLSRLGEPVRDFVLEVERAGGVDIDVALDPQLNGRGPTGQGILSIEVNARQNLLRAPTNGYFPDGAVRHEVLHVQRFHVDGVPKLVLAEEAEWDRALADALGAIDNAIEHVLIVPEELRLHPERREHWEAVMWQVCAGLRDVPAVERSLAICMHWTFLRHVLPGSPALVVARDFATEHALLETANSFADEFLSVATKKEELARLLFLRFPYIPRGRAALEYINVATGTRQMPIP